MKIRPETAEVVLCRRTDMAEITVIFLNFAKAPDRGNMRTVRCGNMYTDRRGNMHAERCGNICGQSCHAKGAENKIKYTILRGILNVWLYP